MKTPIVLIALAFTSMTAFAQEATIFEDDEFVSMKSRAEVQAEVKAALNAGTRLKYGEARRVASAPRQSILARSTVQDRVIDAIEDGQRLKFGEANAKRSMPFREQGSSSEPVKVAALDCDIKK